MEGRVQIGRPEIRRSRMAQLQNLHAVPIVLAAVAAWFFGAIYYGLLCRKWMAAQGKTVEQSRAENAGRSAAAKVAPFILSFIAEDRKSTRLNSSHPSISYAVFCLKKKTQTF